MAVSVAIETGSGVTAMYHRIDSMRLARGGMYEISVNHFYTNEERIANSKPVDTDTEFITEAELQKILIECGYRALKTKERYATSTDIYDTESVTLDQSDVSLVVGSSVTLVATVLPDTATDKSVTWESSDTAIATVSDGIISAIALGEVTITVKTVDRDKMATCKIIVTVASTIE